MQGQRASPAIPQYADGDTVFIYSLRKVWQGVKTFEVGFEGSDPMLKVGTKIRAIQTARTPDHFKVTTMDGNMLLLLKFDNKSSKKKSRFNPSQPSKELRWNALLYNKGPPYACVVRRFQSGGISFTVEFADRDKEPWVIQGNSAVPIALMNALLQGRMPEGSGATIFKITKGDKEIGKVERNLNSTVRSNSQCWIIHNLMLECLNCR
ncbi:hypothetical protein QOT17_016827 [Balamuthia mandrillaris]